MYKVVNALFIMASATQKNLDLVHYIVRTFQ